MVLVEPLISEDYSITLCYYRPYTCYDVILLIILKAITKLKQTQFISGQKKTSQVSVHVYAVI